MRANESAFRVVVGKASVCFKVKCVGVNESECV